jgi:hypothetical protein
MSVAPAGVSNVLIAISGVLQDPATYGVVGNTLNFSQAPPTGTNNISCRYLGVPATGVTTTAYRTQTEFTATAGQTTFSVPSYTPGFIDVYRNGVLLSSTNFVATNGTTVVLNNAASAGDLIETISFLVSSVLNAIPATAGAVGSSNIANGVTINFADGSASTPSITNDGDTYTGMFFPAADTIAFAEGGVESMRIDASGNVGIGTTSPAVRLQAQGSIAANDSTTATRRLQLDISSTAGTINCANYGTGMMDLNVQGQNVIFNTGLIGIAERMRVDSSGRVTTPFQPAFHVKLNNVSVYSTVGAIPFTQVLVNIGSHYSTSTYRFTAPVAGTYAFFFKGFIESATRTSVDFAVNGAQRQGLYGPQGQGDMVVGQLVFTLAANDYVTASLRGGNVFGDGTSTNYDAATFSGYLIG